MINLVYSNRSETCLSGVGRRYRFQEGIWTAPLNEAERWTHGSCYTVTTPVMCQPPAHGCHGFVLHEACWCLLRETFHTEKIPLQRFLEVCDSLPFLPELDGLDWGHDYGGLLPRYWERPFGQQDHPERHSINSRVQLRQIAPANPSILPETRNLLAMPAECPPSILMEQGNDPFMLLPWEILEAIAVLLSTKDA